MDKQDELIRRIIEDAEAYREQTVYEANKTAEQLTLEAEQVGAALINEAVTSAENYGKDILNQRNILASLEVKKEILSAKKRTIDAVFLRTMEKLKALNKKDYLSLINRIIENNAKDGDIVILSSNANFVDEDITLIKKNSTIKINIKIEGNFSGGLIIERNYATLNFSFDALLLEAKDKFEKELYQSLFKEI